jgi:hypothetical protein
MWLGGAVTGAEQDGLGNLASGDATRQALAVVDGSNEGEQGGSGAPDL